MKQYNVEEEDRCIICGSSDILELKCKIQCQNCGFLRDCTDP